MGQSTDAKIWFGLCWTEEDEKYYEDGLPEPVLAHMKSSKTRDIEDNDAAENAVAVILKEFGCELVRHCYCDGAQMFGLAMSASYVCASRGYPINLTTTGMITTGTVGPDWVRKLTAAAEAIGWPWKPPAWWLASYWG